MEVREHFTQHNPLSNINYVRIKAHTPLALPNQSTPSDQKLSSIFARRSNRHLIANKVIDTVFLDSFPSLRKVGCTESETVRKIHVFLLFLILIQSSVFTLTYR